MEQVDLADRHDNGNGHHASAEAPPPAYAVATQNGVRKAEAVVSRRVWGKYSAWLLYIGIAMISYSYALEGETTWLFENNALAVFNKYASWYGTIGTVSAIIIAIGKPVAAKLSNVFGRAEAWTIACTLYTMGFIILAASQQVRAFAAGWFFRSAGYAATQILTVIIIGDVTTLRWRTLVSALVSAPFLWNFAVASNMAADIVQHSGWRWGFGVFAILIPGSTVLIIAVLFWGQFKARKLGIVHTVAPHAETEERDLVDALPVGKRIKTALVEMDAVGLLLFTAGWTCLILPLNLANGGTLPWSSYKIIVMLTLGPIILIGFAIYEARYAALPFIPARFLRNRTVLAAALIGFFDFISFYMQYTYQYAFIYVFKYPKWSLTDMNYFASTQTLSLTIFGITAGAIVFYYRRYKIILFIGLCVRLLAVGVMIHSKGARGSTGELVVVQMLQGLGGGFASALCQTAAQGTVPHQDLAPVTAFLLLFAEIGNSIGTAIATAIWRNTMPGQLDRHIVQPGYANETVANAIYESYLTAVEYPLGSDIRNGAIEAYTYTTKLVLIGAVVFAVVPPLLVLLMKDYRFGNEQNAVEHTDAHGEHHPEAALDSETKK